MKVLLLLWCVIYLGKYDQIWVRKVTVTSRGIKAIDLDGKYKFIEKTRYKDRGYKCYN